MRNVLLYLFCATPSIRDWGRFDISEIILAHVLLYRDMLRIKKSTKLKVCATFWREFLLELWCWRMFCYISFVTLHLSEIEGDLTYVPSTPMLSKRNPRQKVAHTLSFVDFFLFITHPCKSRTFYLYHYSENFKLLYT